MAGSDQGLEDVGDRLSPRQELFCQQYVIDLHGTKAAIRAGYSEHTAASQASRLLKNVKIAARIAQLQDDIAERNQVTADRVVAEMARVAFANQKDYLRLIDGEPAVDLSAVTPGQWAAIKDITVEDFKDGRGDDARDVRRVKIALYDKIPALDRLGKHLGVFVDRQEHTGKNGGPIQTQDTDRARLLEIIGTLDRDERRQFRELLQIGMRRLSGHEDEESTA